MSTFYNPAYARSKFITEIEIINNFQSEKTVDLLNPKLGKLINSLTIFSTRQYQTNEKIVNISYSVYGTTSLWWIIIIATGLIHPYEIPVGTLLYLPNLTELVEAINKLSDTSNKSRVVTI